MTKSLSLLLLSGALLTFNTNAFASDLNEEDGSESVTQAVADLSLDDAEKVPAAGDGKLTGDDLDELREAAEGFVGVGKDVVGAITGIGGKIGGLFGGKDSDDENDTPGIVVESDDDEGDTLPLGPGDGKVTKEDFEVVTGAIGTIAGVGKDAVGAITGIGGKIGGLFGGKDSDDEGEEGTPGTSVEEASASE